MKKVNITLAFEEDKLDALEFSLKKENASVQSRMEDALRQLYEKTVPEPVREYLDSRAAPAAKPKRPPKTAKPQAAPAEVKHAPPVVAPTGSGAVKETK